MDDVESKYDKQFSIRMLSFLKSQGYIMRNFNDDLDYVHIAAVRRDLN